MIHETQPQWQKKSYHSVAVVVSVVFLIMLLAGIVFVVHGKQRASEQLERQSFSTEQQLLKALLDEPLLRYDFAQMTATLTHFFEGNPNYVSIRLYGPNHSQLYAIERPVASAGTTHHAEIVIGDSRRSVSLHVTKKQLVSSSWWPDDGWMMVARIALGCIIFSQLMWWFIKRFGLDPLYAGVIREQRYYRSLFDQAQEAIFIMSDKGELLRLNQAARRLFNLPHTLSGRNLRQFHSEANWHKVNSFIEKIKQQGRHSETVYLASIDLCVEILGSQIVLEDETLIQLLILDITEQYHTEQELKKLEEELTRGLDEYRMLFDYSVDGLTVRNLAGELLLCNKPYEAMLGRSFEELKNQHYTRLCKPLEQEELNEKYRQALTNGSVLFEFVYQHKDGYQFPVEIRSIVIEYRGETCVLSAVRDISERREKDQRLRELSTVIDYSNDAILITDEFGKVLAVNKRFCDFSGYADDDLLGAVPLFLMSERHDKDFYGHFFQQLRREGHWEGETWIRHAKGHSLPQWLRIKTVENPEDQTSRYVAVSADLSEEKAWEEKMLQLAQTDPLTGSANRVLFRDRLQQAIKRAQTRKGARIQVFSLDLDYFKRINDSLGHVAGDRVLIEVASRLKKVGREQDTISRLSGDEFAILVTCLNDEVDATRMAQKMLDALSLPMVIDGSELIISASIGIALYPGDGEDDASVAG
nr:PAS domain S-box protein [uncultured Desulfuromonas sp.]